MHLTYVSEPAKDNACNTLGPLNYLARIPTVRVGLVWGTLVGKRRVSWLCFRFGAFCWSAPDVLARARSPGAKRTRPRCPAGRKATRTGRASQRRGRASRTRAAGACVSALRSTASPPLPSPSAHQRRPHGLDHPDPLTGPLPRPQQLPVTPGAQP